MPIKISKVIRDLNVGRLTIEDFLRKKHIEVDTSNVNARIDDSVYEMLIKEFKPDMEQKSRATALTSGRQKERPARKVEEIKTEVPGQKPRVLGKIDLSRPGGPIVADQPAEAKQPAAEPAAEKPIEAEKPVVAEPPVAEKPAVKEQPVAAPEPKQATDKAPRSPKKTEKPAAKPAAAKPEKPAEQPAKPLATEPEKPAEQPAEAAGPEEPAVFSLPKHELEGPKVIGKIDLANLEPSGRSGSKKKSKDVRGGAATGDRKKRKRINGKEKIDITKVQQAAPAQPATGGSQRGGKPGDAQGGRGGARKDKKSKRPLRPEVKEEDVQRQVKETLARLTAKPSRKAAKLRKEKRDAVREEIAEEARQAAAESTVLQLTEFVTVNDLASMMNVPINKVIGACMSLGLMVSINMRLDASVIDMVAEEFGFTTEYVSTDINDGESEDADNPEDLVPRPPVVTVMGHVDHGKTSLLDHIRNTNVIAGEAGGITQHIGAYNVCLKNGRHITFLDTPGHAAFTAMRARGAKVTDIAIVIVAADDNVMPQTKEALSHASAAGVPIIFAINKIDKPGADPERIKQELASLNYLVEDWGGTYQSQDISAKKGTGVYELLEKVLLQADLLELKANPQRKATGSVIESSLDKGRGYVATVLVDNGTLHVGDIVLAGTHYGKVKAMFNERNQRITEAGPATPALILGLNGAPTAGDKFVIMNTDQEARQAANKREQLQRELLERTKKRLTLDDIARRKALGDFHELNIVVKGDVDGSIEALSDSLIKLSTEEVKVNVLLKAVGAISESDVSLAAASDAFIVGFQVRPSAEAKAAAAREGVDIRIYSIIYDAIEEVKSAMEGMLSPDVKEEIIGSAEILQVYHISKVGNIAGAIVREGKIKRQCKVRVIRDGIVIHTGTLASLKRFKDDAKEVASGFDCGFSIQAYNDIKEGDIIEAFEEVEVQKHLS